MLEDTSTNQHAFSHKRLDDIACIYLHRGAFHFGTNLEEKEQLFELFDELCEQSDIKAVLLFNDECAFSTDEHKNYISSVTKMNNENFQDADALLSRQDRALAQYALKTIECTKVLVSCLSGDISTPFFGLSLASDIRLATKGMQFSLSHVECGVPPTGGLGYYLPRYVGQGDAAKLLLLGGKIDADKALEKGLIHAVLDTDSFEDRCVQWIRQALPSVGSSIAPTRQLLYFNKEEMASFFQRELKYRRQALTHWQS